MNDRAPLAGRTVVVTRPAEQAGPLVDLLAAAGARAIVTPLIEIVADPAATAALEQLDVTGFDWVVVTSRNAALALMAAHGSTLGDRRRALDRPAVAAVGTATAAVVGTCRLVPADQRAEGLLAEMPPPHGTAKVLVVQAADAAATLVGGLRAAGWEVAVNAPYRSVPAHPTARQQLAALAADAVLFASGSAAQAWVHVFGTTTPPVTVAIGPQTAAAARQAGLEVTTVASTHSLVGMVAALRDALDDASRQ